MKSSRVHVDIEEIVSLDDRRREINSYDLNEIVFCKNGKEIDIDPELVDEFKFVGLNNNDFILTGFYLSGFQTDDE